MTLVELAAKIEANEPRAICTVCEQENQIIVTFKNRPDVEIALLTPYYQSLSRKNSITENDVCSLLIEIKGIVEPKHATF